MRPACPPPPTVAVAVSVAAWLGALCCCAGPAAAELGVEARLAWEGYARPEQWTELTLRIASDRGGPVELEIGGAWPVRSEIQIEAGRTRTVRLPAQPGLDGDAISVQVNGPGGSASTRVSPRFPPAGRRTVAFVAAEPHASGAFTSLAVEPDGLPRSAWAFATADALVIEGGALARLDAAQLGALRDYVRACGRVLGVDVPPAQLAEWRSAAGCDGAHLANAGAGDAVEERLSALLALPLPASPTARASARAPAARDALVAFFVLYAVAFGVGTLVLRRAATLLIVPLAATVLLGAGLMTRPASISFSADGRHTRLHIDGLAPDQVAVDLPAHLGPPASAMAADRTALRWGLDGSRAGVQRIELATHLLSRHDFSFRFASELEGASALEGGVSP